MNGLPVIVTDHAVQRYVERIGGTEAAAQQALRSPAIATAAEFGARSIRIGTLRILLNHRADAVVVITVVPFKEWPPRELRPASLGGPAPLSRPVASLLP